MNNPLKSITIRGDLSNKNIKYMLCPDYLQLQFGTWEISISDVLFYCPTTEEPIRLQNSIFLELSSNVVQGHSFSLSRRLCKENIILTTVLFDNEKKLSIIKPNVRWFIVNNTPSDYLVIFINQWPKRTVIESGKVLLSVNILFRRIV